MRHRADIRLQFLIIARGDLVPHLDLFGKDGELFQEDCRLDRVEARIHADADVEIFRVMVEARPGKISCNRLAMHVQRADQARQSLVIGQHGPAIAIATERLGRKKAGRDNISEVRRVAAIDRGAEALRAVGDQFQAVCVGDLAQARIVCRLAEQAHADDHARGQLAFRQRALDLRFEVVRIDIVSVRLDVDEDRRRPQPRHHLACRAEGKGWAEHRVTRLDAPGH